VGAEEEEGGAVLSGGVTGLDQAFIGTLRGRGASLLLFCLFLGGMAESGGERAVGEESPLWLAWLGKGGAVSEG